MTPTVTRLLSAAIVSLIGAVPLALHAQQAREQPPPDPQRPVFRGGAYFVTVDVYPLLNGRVLHDLTAGDFEVLEDGRPQKIETFEFVRISPATPDVELRDPNNLREMRDRIADPRTRVFVLYLDTYHIDWFGAVRVRSPLVQMMDRILAPTDLFGVMTSTTTAREITFSRKTNSLEQQIARHWPTTVIDKKILDEWEQRLEDCYKGTPAESVLGEAIARHREDLVLSGLEELVNYLGALREGRKSVFVFSPGWRLFGRNPALIDKVAQLGPTKGPPVGITSTGKLILGNKVEHGTAFACDQEISRLANLENDFRFRQLLRRAENANVSFYPVDPTGVGAAGRTTDQLRSLASETDGMAVVMNNDLGMGLDRVSDSLSAYYLLGYSSTNTKFDGLPRRITVKVKQPNVDIKARRGYLAPSEAEIAALRSGGSHDPGGASTLEAAMAGLSRLRPGAAVHSYAYPRDKELIVVTELSSTAIDSGQWKGGAEVQVSVSTPSGESGTGRGDILSGSRAAVVRIPLSGRPGPWQVAVRVRGTAGESADERVTVPPASGTLLGEPQVFRGRTASAPMQPAAAFQFARTERVRIEWPVLTTLDRRQGRLLGRNGQPLAVPVTLTERESNGIPVLAADVALTPLSAADYLVEVEAGAGSVVEKKLLAIRVGR